jgi:hypothetical protein
MSVWQFNAATGGVVKSRTPEDEQGLSSESAASMSALLDQVPQVLH